MDNYCCFDSSFYMEKSEKNKKRWQRVLENKEKMYNERTLQKMLSQSRKNKIEREKNKLKEEVEDEIVRLLDLVTGFIILERNSWIEE